MQISLEPGIKKGVYYPVLSLSLFNISSDVFIVNYIFILLSEF